MTTNYERIKNMTVEEMAELFDEYITCRNCPASDFCERHSVDYCSTILEQWLQSESEDK